MNPIVLTLIAIWLFVAPWPASGSHLLEKITWLQTGHPMAAVDWFDIVWHGVVPPALIGWSVFNFLKTRKAKTQKIES